MFSQCHTQITLLHCDYSYCVFMQHSSSISSIGDICIVLFPSCLFSLFYWLSNMSHLTVNIISAPTLSGMSFILSVFKSIHK